MFTHLFLRNFQRNLFYTSSFFGSRRAQAQLVYTSCCHLDVESWGNLQFLTALKILKNASGTFFLLKRMFKNMWINFSCIFLIANFMFSNRISLSKFYCRRFENVNIHDPYQCTLLALKNLFSMIQECILLLKNINCKDIFYTKLTNNSSLLTFETLKKCINLYLYLFPRKDIDVILSLVY